jgi:glycosyltransferase involved in cell wall biosynthesis
MLVCSPVERYYACRREHPTPDKPYRARELRALELLARRNAQRGRHYVVLSEHLAEVVRGHGTRRPVRVIPVYGVDVERFRPTDDDSAARRRDLGLPVDGAVIFFSSRIAPEKDGETLLAALRRLLDAGRDVWLLHLSGGFQTFQAYAERAGVAHRVIARDAVHPEHELPDFYRLSDLCVQASREEGLGFSPLEALACETPVVAAAVGGLRETIVDGETGWTYPAGDAAALARTMEAALDQRDEAMQRARVGRSMVSDRYERHIVFDRLMEALGEA